MASPRSARWAIVAAGVVIILALVGIVVWKLNRPSFDPPRNVLDEIADVSLADRPGPFENDPRFDIRRYSNNQESEHFHYFNYFVQNSSVSEIEDVAVLQIISTVTFIDVTQEITSGFFLRGRYAYPLDEPRETVIFTLQGFQGDPKYDNEIPASEVEAMLEEMGKTPEDLELMFREAVNELFIEPWTEVYDSAFTPDDWGEIELVNRGVVG